MTGLIARLPRARTTLILALSFLLLAFATNASAQRVQPHRTAHAQPHAHTKAVKKKPHRKKKAVKHRRSRVTHQAAKRHAAPAPQPRRAKRTTAWPDSVGRTGFVRISSTRPVRCSSALIR